MLVNLNTAADLVEVQEKTILRYTYPYFTDKREAVLDKTKVTGKYMVDTIDLKNAFPQYTPEIDEYENITTETTRRLIQQKVTSAVANKDFYAAHALIDALKVL
jgi:hypothetical protein